MVTHIKTIVLSSSKQASVTAGLMMFKHSKLKKAQVEELYEAIILTADSSNTVRLFAMSAAKTKSKEQGLFMDKICEVRLDPAIVIKAVDYYTAFSTIVVSTDTDVIKITNSLQPKRASDTGVQLPVSMLDRIVYSTVFEVGQTEYRACGLSSGELSLLDGDDLADWGEQVIKTFQPLTAMKLSKTLMTDCTSAIPEPLPKWAK